MTLYKKIQDWAARLLIRSKRLKEVRYNAQQLDEMIGECLPHSEEIEVPGGRAKLIVMTAQVCVGNNNMEGLVIKLLCSLDISSLNRQLYRAHLNAEVKALPYYHKAQKTIRFKETKITELTLVNDEYLLIKNANDTIKSLTPNILKGIVNVTIGSAIGVMSEVATPAVKEYLTVFTEANKQKVLDLHRFQIEKMLHNLISNGDIEYQLEACDFEEKIFADLGQQIDVDEHNVVFKF
jgi:hypothetical protein